MDIAEQRYERNPDFVFRKIIDELILVPVRVDLADMESIYSLNEVGAFIWNRLDGQATLSEIQSAVQEEYDVVPEAAGEDVVGFLQELDGIGAVRRL